MRFKPSREWYVPKGATMISDKQSDAIAYVYQDKQGRPCARVFYGKQAKPVLHCYFRNEAQREKSVTTAFESRRAHLGRKKEERAKRSSWEPTYKVGDIFRTSWGYEQTNVEYFEIIEIRGKHAILRELQQERVETGWAQGNCSPLPGKYAEPRYESDERGRPIRRLMQQGGIRIDDVRYAWPLEGEMVGGVKVYRSSSWSAYH